MDLSTLKNLGLPEWLIILAVLVFILKQVGALNFIYSRLVDTSEHKQQSEDRQTDWSRMEEILADIDAAMHEIKTSVRIDVNPKTR